MAGLRLNNKSIVVLIALGIVSTYLTAYTVVAHAVARHVYDPDGTIAWTSGPSGSFFPWPRPPGMLQILTEMSGTDVFIYTYLIKPWTLVALATLLWVCWVVYFLMLIRKPSQPKKRDQAQGDEKEAKTDLQELRKRFEIPPPG